MFFEGYLLKMLDTEAYSWHDAAMRMRCLLTAMALGASIAFANENEGNEEEQNTPAPIYIPVDINDAYEYILSQAMECASEIRMQLKPEFTSEDQDNLFLLLGVYRLGDSYRYKKEKDEDGNTILSLMPTYKSCVKMLKAYRDDNAGDLELQDKAALDKAKSILQQLNINDGMTMEEKARTIHDWMIANCAYDEFAYKNSQQFSGANFSAYDPWDGKFMILQNKGVCDSYAQAYWLLLQMSNVPCSMMGGSANGEGHAWNLVYLDDHWAHVDVTFDDPIPDRPGRICDVYFNLNDKEIGENHEWKAELFPNATFDSLFSSSSAAVAFDNGQEATSFVKSTVTKPEKECRITLPDSESRSCLQNATENGNVLVMQDPLYPNVLRVKFVKRQQQKQADSKFIEQQKQKKKKKVAGKS